MIEGQEGVTWQDWCALAHTCEEHGVETLFRSDHYISQGAEAHNVAFHDAIIQCSFKFDGAKVFSLSINDAKGHVCRVTITPTSLVVKKDDIPSI